MGHPCAGAGLDEVLSPECRTLFSISVRWRSISPSALGTSPLANASGDLPMDLECVRRVLHRRTSFDHQYAQSGQDLDEDAGCRVSRETGQEEVDVGLGDLEHFLAMATLRIGR